MSKPKINAASWSPDEEAPGVDGRWLVLPVLVVVALAVAMVGAYTVVTWGEPRERMEFVRLDGVDPSAPVLDAKEVRTLDRFLDAHLHKTEDVGVSVETIALRVDAMRTSLERLTQSAGPAWVVTWSGHTFRVTWTVEGTAPPLGASPQ